MGGTYTEIRQIPLVTITRFLQMADLEAQIEEEKKQSESQNAQPR